MKLKKTVGKRLCASHCLLYVYYAYGRKAIFAGLISKKSTLFHSYGGDMGIYPFVPVEVSFHIYGIAYV